MEILGVNFTFTEGGELKMINNGDNKFLLKCVDPNTGYVGYSNFHFNKGVWSETVMSYWPNKPTTINIVLLSKTNKVTLLVNFNNKSIEEISLQEKVENYKVYPTGLSILISAYRSGEFLDVAIRQFLQQIEKTSDLNCEIIVGIDGCYDTLEFISQKDYPSNVRFYFFKENVGTYFVRNTLSSISKYDNLLFFDSDDIPMENMLIKIINGLRNYEVVKYCYREFYDDLSRVSEISTNASNGTFAIRKVNFYQLNGFYTWRIIGDSEFNRRIELNKLNVQVIEEPLFYYRRDLSGNQLTQNKFSGYGSKLRNVYETILFRRNFEEGSKNPLELKIAECIRVF